MAWHGRSEKAEEQKGERGIEQVISNITCNTAEEEKNKTNPSFPLFYFFLKGKTTVTILC